MILDFPGATERRQTPRYLIRQPADLMMDDGSVLTVTTRNSSSNGLQIICDSWVTNKIEPRGIQKHNASHIKIKSIIELDVADESKILYANGRMVSVQRMSQDEYMVSIIFTDFENGSEKILDEFLRQYVQKKTVINATA